MSVCMFSVYKKYNYVIYIYIYMNGSTFIEKYKYIC